MTTNRVDIGDIEVAYLEAGDPEAPLALCLHGFPDHAHTYDALLPALADAGYHAVSPWLRGYAPTSLAPDGIYEVPKLATDCLATIDALGSDGTVLVGHDWGATIVYAACAMAPERVRRAVTMAVPHPNAFAPIFLSNYDQQKRSFYMFVFQLEGLAEGIVSANDMEFIDRLVADWSPRWNRTETDRAHLREAIGSPENLTAALSYYRQMIPTTQSQDPDLVDLRAKAAAPIETPTLQLFGADDGCIDPTIVPDQSAFFAGELDVEIVPDVGHFMLQDDTDAVVPRILGWLGVP